MWGRTAVYLLTAFLAVMGAENVTPNNEDLISVIMFYRHGDRTPINPYPKDPYKNSSYWPVGFGQLTNLGKEQHYELGKWIRNRYNDFLPSDYSEKDIYIRSTDVDRTLMSAYANLAGLYEPSGKQMWNTKIDWQPIPVHTLPEKEDFVLAMKHPCAKYSRMLDDLMKTREFVDFRKKHHDLLAYISRNAGVSVGSIEQVEFIYNTLLIESFYNYTLPDWTKKIFPEKMKPIAVLSFAIPCYTPELKRLKTGPLFNEIINNLINSSKKTADAKKFHVYSGHDTTIANILNTMGLFEYHSPPYTSSVILELRSRNDDFYVNIFYKNSTEARKLKLDGCDVDCPINDFIRILEPVLIKPDEWFSECEISKWEPLFAFFSVPDVIIVVGSMMFLALIMSIVLGVFCTKPKSEKRSYLRLPDSDEAA